MSRHSVEGQLVLMVGLLLLGLVALVVPGLWSGSPGGVLTCPAAGLAFGRLYPPGRRLPGIGTAGAKPLRHRDPSFPLLCRGGFPSPPSASRALQ